MLQRVEQQVVTVVVNADSDDINELLRNERVIIANQFEKHDSPLRIQNHQLLKQLRNCAIIF